MMNMRRLILIFMLAALIFGCSSDSPQPGTAKLTLATSGNLPAGTSLAGIGMTLTLPAGVTPALDNAGQVDASRLATASGVTAAGGLAVTAVYVEATAGTPARLSLAAASKAAAGFGVGETMIVTLNRLTTSSPGTTDFVITGFSAADLSGNAVIGLQAAVTGLRLE
jgi:hypothetical protein